MFSNAGMSASAVRLTESGMCLVMQACLLVL